MKFLIKTFNLLKNKVESLPKLSLCNKRIKIEPVTQRPYFLIGPIGLPLGEAIENLYLDDLKNNMDYYQKQFSIDDWISIQYNLGGIESLQIGGIYQIIEFDLENIQVKVRNKSSLQQETWEIASLVSKKQYLNLDKQSIFEFGMFYQNVKNSPALQEKVQKEVEKQMNDSLYMDKFKNTSNIDENQKSLPMQRYKHLALVK